MKITVLIAESRTLARQGLVELLHKDAVIEVVGEATNGFEALDKARELGPNIVLMDHEPPGLDGISATRLIVQKVPAVRVIMLPVASHMEQEVILNGVRNGARGYIREGADAAAVIEHIKRVASGGVALTEEATSKSPDSLAPRLRGFQDPQQLFTAREKEVLDLIRHGVPNKEIASTLSMSENIVRAHIQSLMQKINVQWLVGAGQDVRDSQLKNDRLQSSDVVSARDRSLNHMLGEPFLTINRLFRTAVLPQRGPL